MNRSTLRIVGSIIMALGIICAFWIHWNAQHPPEEIPYADDLDALDSRKYGHDLEMYNGKVGVLMDKWMRAAKDLGHSETFATGVALVSVAAGISCFVVASRRS